MKTDTKISLRISQVELDNIDDFLVRHQEFKTRSDFIRYATMKQLELMEKGQQLDEEIVPIKINKKFKLIFSDLVDINLFSSIDEAVNFFLERSVQTNKMNEELSTLMQGFVSLDKLVDNYKIYQEDRATSRIKKEKGDFRDRK
ncbi:MAG: hypothetical protein ACP5SF_00550 [Thermoplasmata archaeon]